MIPTPRMELVAGTDRDFTWQTPNGDGSTGGVFVAADAVTSKLWMGDREGVLAAPAVAWGSPAVAAGAGAAQSLWTVQFRASDTASLAPGRYRFQVYGAHAGRNAVLWDGLVDLGDAPGSATGTDLITLTYAESALGRIRLNAAERDFLAPLVTTASDTVRKWCGQRDFNRQTYTEESHVGLDGWAGLRQYPVNAVSRIRGFPDVVLTLTADPSVYQQAWINYTTAGGWAAGTLAYTGLNLNGWASGSPYTLALPFATSPTVGALAAAIAAAPGWRAPVAGSYASYPTADLSPPGGLTSQGALAMAGARLTAYTADLGCTRLDNRTGFLWVGRDRAGGPSFGPEWGPGWEALTDGDARPSGRIQVTYDAGFDVIPTPVQLATAELCKALVERLRSDHMLGSESIGGAGSRAYQVAAELVGLLPRPVLQGLSLFRRISVR